MDDIYNYLRTVQVERTATFNAMRMALPAGRNGKTSAFYKIAWYPVWIPYWFSTRPLPDQQGKRSLP